MGQSRCGRGETKTYGLVFSLHIVDRVGSFHSPTLLYQQTNCCAVDCVQPPFTLQEVVSRTSGNVCHASEWSLLYTVRSSAIYS